MKNILLISIIIVTLLFLLFLIILLFIPVLLPIYLQSDLSNRLALAQLAIEIASLIALIIAIYQFLNAQKKPKLRLFLQPYDETRQFISGEKIITIKNRGNIMNFVDIPFYYRFFLHFENYGDKAARWVKISLQVEDNESPGERSSLALRDGINGWKPDNRNDYQHRYDFNGGDDFISYNHPAKISHLDGWTDQLAQFILIVPSEITSNPRTIRLICYIWADECPRIEQAFIFQNLLNTN